MGRRSAIFGLTVFLLVAAQCFAICAVVPCSVPQPVKSSCHHDDSREPAPCGHEGFVTEMAPQSDPVAAVQAFAPPVSPGLAPLEARAFSPAFAFRARVAPDLPFIAVLRI